MASLEARIEALEAPSLYSIPIIIFCEEDCRTISEARAKYEKIYGINPDQYQGGKVLYVTFDD